MKTRNIIAFLLLNIAIQLHGQWTPVNVPDYTHLRGTTFLDSSLGYVCGFNPSTDSGYYGKLWLTFDAGLNWGNITSLKNHSFNDVVKTDSNRVWVVGDSGLVFKCNDMGYFFEWQKLTVRSLKAGASVGDNIFYCAGSSGVMFRTFNAGLTWDTLNSGTFETIHDIRFINASTGWIAAGGGYIAATSDSGNTWTPVFQPLFGFNDFYGLDFKGTSTNNPYVVGQNSTALLSGDGGSNWSSLTTGSTGNLNQVLFGTANGGLICGDNGFIFRTADGGNSWMADSTPTSQDLYDAAYDGYESFFVCGDSGSVLRSTNDITSIEQADYSSMSLHAYPNPFNNSLFLKISSDKIESYTIVISSVSGQLIRTEQIPLVTSGRNIIELPTEDLVSGLYFITLTSYSGSTTIPVIKQ